MVLQLHVAGKYVVNEFLPKMAPWVNRLQRNPHSNDGITASENLWAPRLCPNVESHYVDQPVKCNNTITDLN